MPLALLGRSAVARALAAARRLLPLLLTPATARAALGGKSVTAWQAEGAPLTLWRLLTERVAELATGLRDAGVKPGDLVGIALRRSTDMVATALAIQRSIESSR